MRKSRYSWWLLTVLVLGLGLSATPLMAQEQSLTLEVAPDLTTFDAVRQPAEGEPFPTGPFYVEGPIYPEGTLNADGTAPEGAEAIGTFRCWGWLFDGKLFGASVSQAYELSDQGDIQTQGREGAEVRVVTGGSGAFVGARGLGTVAMINPDNFSFRIQFALE